jgi:hypothetical protein
MWRIHRFTTFNKNIKKGSSLFFQKENKQIISWCEKKPVVLITTVQNVKEITFSDSKLSPAIVDKYNKNVGCVDKFDQMV